MFRMESLKPPSIPALTGLRFFAAMAVLLFHYGAGFSAGILPAPVTKLLHNGYLGVSVFFVLSGFILTYTYQNDPMDRRFVARFLFARFARIYPVYLLALIVAIPNVPRTSLDVGLVLTMVQSWTPPSSLTGYLWVTQAWTLSVELFFYLMFPVILLVARQMNVAAIMFLAIVCAALIIILGIPSISPGTERIPFVASDVILLPVFRSVEFLYGVLLCRLMVFYRLDTGPIFGAALLIAMILVMCFAWDVHSVAVFTILAGVLIVHLAAGTGFVVQAFSTSLMLLLGGASYALYLLQEPIRMLPLVAHPFDRFVSPIVTILSAITVFLFWEQPARKILLSAYKVVVGRVGQRQSAVSTITSTARITDSRK
jgi:peptidoglycan/LPS O-acetylase OafA/YrhL